MHRSGHRAAGALGLSRIVVLIVAMLSALLVLGGPAHSDPAGNVPMGAGSAIRVANAMNVPWCTVAAVGNDRFGNIVGITAGHCAETVGDPVYAAGRDAAESPIGRVDFISPPARLDYAVIVFDAERVRPVNSVTGTQIDDIGEPPALGGLVCKFGHTTGITCGVIAESSTREIRTWAFSFYGDSGGPLLAGRKLVGICGGGQGLPTVYPSMVAIKADLDARRAAGSDFVLARAN